jgi:hypothetical protein
LCSTPQRPLAAPREALAALALDRTSLGALVLERRCDRSRSYAALAPLVPDDMPDPITKHHYQSARSANVRHCLQNALTVPSPNC